MYEKNVHEIWLNTQLCGIFYELKYKLFLILNIRFWGWSTNVCGGYQEIVRGLTIGLISKNLRCCGHGGGRAPPSNNFGKSKTPLWNF